MFNNVQINQTPKKINGTVIKVKPASHPAALYDCELTVENIVAEFVISIQRSHRGSIPDLSAIGTPLEVSFRPVNSHYEGVARWDMLKRLESPESLDHLPESWLPAFDSAFAVDNFLQDCPIEPLKRFALRVLGVPLVGSSFFTIPVTRGDHYSYTGGLAAYSLDVALRAYAITHMLPEEDRWIAAVGGLLHDVANVWHARVKSTRLTRTVGALPNNPVPVVLASSFQCLMREWPIGANLIKRTLYCTMHDISHWNAKIPLTAAAIMAARRASIGQDKNNGGRNFTMGIFNKPGPQIIHRYCE